MTSSDHSNRQAEGASRPRRMSTRAWRWLTGAEQREATKRAVAAIDVIQVEWPATNYRVHDLETRVEGLEQALKAPQILRCLCPRTIETGERIRTHNECPVHSVPNAKWRP